MIRYKSLISIILWLSGTVCAQVSVQLCDPCDLAPMSANQVMVGKKCSLRIISDANDLWSGGLFLVSDPNGATGVLEGRDKDPNSRDRKGSHLAAAGPKAKVYTWNDSAISGFDFYTSEYECQAGPWFLIDYKALQPGDCRINYYDHSASWTRPDPNVLISIENIPNVDFYVDNVVDMKDFMIMASHWLEEGCSDPEWCRQTDVNRDGEVGIADVTLFARYWLWGGAGYSVPSLPELNEVPEPNAVEPPVKPEAEPSVDPNVIFRIQDANDFQVITLSTGDSVRLYLTKETLGEDVFVVAMEVNISDPNLGSIDNTEYNFADPNHSGSAEILASPRISFFDYYGPGYAQSEGIQYTMANITGAIQDGPVASFVYTATQPGDVVLMLENYMDSTRLEPIVIHQVDDGSQMPADPNALTEFLESVWDGNDELQGTTSLEAWEAFIEAVKESY
jgi:hypothetical protein